MTSGWLHIHPGDAPLIVCFPHGGTGLCDLDPTFASPWLARVDTDWWIADLYDFARELGATTIATDVSRSVIDVNRDPSGQSLYPGQATTELCPTTTFDGISLYQDAVPDEAEIARRRATWFAPYHEAVREEIGRLRARSGKVVLYDAHSIRSRVPRLFEGTLPLVNIGTNQGRSCSAELAQAFVDTCRQHDADHVLDGRFKGGWTTRHYGAPATGVEAIQIELAMRAYLTEPDIIDPSNWPARLDRGVATPTTRLLQDLLRAALTIAR